MRACPLRRIIPAHEFTWARGRSPVGDPLRARGGVRSSLRRCDGQVARSRLPSGHGRLGPHGRDRRCPRSRRRLADRYSHAAADRVAPAGSARCLCGARDRDGFSRLSSHAPCRVPGDRFDCAGTGQSVLAVLARRTRRCVQLGHSARQFCWRPRDRPTGFRRLRARRDLSTGRSRWPGRFPDPYACRVQPGCSRSPFLPTG